MYLTYESSVLDDRNSRLYNRKLGIIRRSISCASEMKLLGSENCVILHFANTFTAKFNEKAGALELYADVNGYGMYKKYSTSHNRSIKGQEQVIVIVFYIECYTELFKIKQKRRNKLCP